MLNLLNSSLFKTLFLSGVTIFSASTTFAQASSVDLKTLLDNAILELGAEKTEQDVRARVSSVLAASEREISDVSSAIVGVITSARSRSDYVTVRALEERVYEDTEFECKTRDNLIFKIWLGIDRLPEDRTEVEIQDDVEVVLGQCGASNSIVAEGLTQVIQEAQLANDTLTVLALTNMRENRSEEIVEGSAEINSASTGAKFVSPVSAPPSGDPVGGSDY